MIIYIFLMVLTALSSDTGIDGWQVLSYQFIDNKGHIFYDIGTDDTITEYSSLLLQSLYSTFSPFMNHQAGLLCSLIHGPFFIHKNDTIKDIILHIMDEHTLLFDLSLTTGCSQDYDYTC